MNKENQRITLTKRLLKEGLLRLLQDKPLKEIPVTELCRESGINRATFYKHYSIPDDVLTDLAADMAADIRALAPDKEEQFFDGTYLETICTYLQQHKNTVKILIEANTDQQLAVLFADLCNHFWESSPYLGKHGHAKDSDRLLVSTFISSGSYHLIRLWLTQEIDKTPAEISRLVTQILQ
ncbi:MAG: TetR/AcrR family transcriptional regulator [Roseburia sp.]|nr:TetR/AcrR family transcriptional regulator [Roseburia sp.]